MLPKRSHPRAAVDIVVLCASGTDRGSGILASLSLSGALLETTSIQPPVGAAVEIRIRQPNDDKPLALAGIAVRHSASGFAIQFSKSAEVVRQLLKRGILPSET